MKVFKLILGIAFLTVITWSCKNETNTTAEVTVTEEVAANETQSDVILAKAEFTVEGMTCAIGCAKTIEKKLATMEGVKSATVDFDKQLAMVEYDQDMVTTSSLEETVTDAGETYTVSGMKTVTSFTSNGAKKGCDKDCKKACCAGKDKKECKKGDKSKCSHKTEKAQANAGDSEKACKDDCKKACCVSKA